MLGILLVTFPFFALVLCGYVAARRAFLPQAAIPGLNTFVLYFALPCMLYRFGANTPIRQLLDVPLMALYTLCALVMVAFTIAVTRNRRIGWNDASFGALVAAFPNTGFMGVPLLVALLGAQAAGPAIVTIVVDMLLTSSLCIALSRLDGADEHSDKFGPHARHQGAVAAPQGGARALGRPGAARAARLALKGVLLNPLPWAIVLGGLSSALALKLFKPLMDTVGLLADAASPVALFTIGAILARSQMNSATRTPLTDYVPVAFIKLVLHPLLVGLVGLGAIALGLPLDRFALTVVVLVAALPSASNVAMLAERFGADNGRIARIILLSTVLAFFSFSAAVALLA
ncbi:MAG: AEC family transporter [Pseudomonadota bacterium]